MYVIKSKINPLLYFNGSAIEKNKLFLALFSPISNARIFDTASEANQVAEILKTPVEVMEI